MQDANKFSWVFLIRSLEIFWKIEKQFEPLIYNLKKLLIAETLASVYGAAISWIKE